MKLLLYQLCFLLALAGARPQQVSDPIPDQFADGWKRSQALMRFAQKDLYGYIDGGAELFLEFGFSELLVQRYQRQDDEMSLDLYQMESADAALAVYLAKRGPEQPMLETDCRHSGGDYQITALCGRWFVQVNNHNGKPENRPAMLALFQAVLKRLPRETPQEWFVGLPVKAIAGSEVLVAGPFSLQSIFTFGEGDILQLAGRQFGRVVDYPGGDGSRQTWLEVNYGDSLTSRQVMENLARNLDPYLQKIKGGGDTLLFKDYNHQYGRVVRSAGVLQAWLHLPQP